MESVDRPDLGALTLKALKLIRLQHNSDLVRNSSHRIPTTSSKADLMHAINAHEWKVDNARISPDHWAKKPTPAKRQAPMPAKSRAPITTYINREAHIARVLSLVRHLRDKPEYSAVTHAQWDDLRSQLSVQEAMPTRASAQADLIFSLSNHHSLPRVSSLPAGISPLAFTPSLPHLGSNTGAHLRL